jgi:hypothetical protein
VPYYNPNLDDLLAFDGIRSFTGGQASGLQSDNLAENQVLRLSNMTLSPRGQIETRLGFSNFCTTATSGTSSVGGLAYYDTSNHEQLATVANGRLTTIETSGVGTLQPETLTWATSATTWEATNRKWATGFAVPANYTVNMVQFNNLLYLVDGNDSLQVWDGEVVRRQGGRLMSVTVTNAGSGYTSAVSVVGGPQIGGTYPSHIATVAGGAVTGVVVSDGGTGYISAPTVTIVGDGTGATATANVSPPPTGLRLLAVTGNRLVATGSGVYRNTLYASDILDASVWPDANSIVVGGDDGEQITAIVPFYANRLLVFKSSKIFQVTIPPDMTSAADWVVEILSSNVGCAAERTALQVNADVFFLAADGIRTVRRSVSDDFSTVGLPVSEIVRDVIADINQAAIANAVAVFHDNRYFLAVPTGSNDANDTVLVYNTILGAFEGTWTPAVLQFARSNFGGQGRRLCAKGQTGIITQYNGYKATSSIQSSDYQDSGGDYASLVRTRDMIFGDPTGFKHGSHYEVIFDRSGATDLDISIQRNTDTGDIISESNVNVSSSVLTLPFVLPAVLPLSANKRLASDLRKYDKWRSLNISINCEGGQFAVRQITAAANPDTIEVQKNI